MDTVIVALPSVGEKVYRISSEKVPHLTILYLGEANLSADAVLYVEHAASELSPFYGTVEHRGTLGADDADVLFFEDNGWDLKRVKEFRHWLLLNDEIKRAYDAAPQYEQWTPHLTLGYPESPAAEDDSDYPGIHSVRFDRISVWLEDSEGPTFRLKYDEPTMEVAMSDLSTAERGEHAAEELFHYGVKGMKWGVRTKDRASQKTPTEVTVTQKKPGTFAKTKGGKNQPLHGDAEKALVARRKAKSSTTDALSNKELRDAVERMQLERKFSELEFSNDRRKRGSRFAAGLFGHRKPTKYRDMDEEYGENVRAAVKEILEDRS